MSQSDIENLKRYIDEKLDPMIHQHTDMYEAYTTIRQGSVWIKYGFWFIGSAIGAILAVKEYFKH